MKILAQNVDKKLLEQAQAGLEQGGVIAHRVINLMWCWCHAYVHFHFHAFEVALLDLVGVGEGLQRDRHTRCCANEHAPHISTGEFAIG